MSRVLQRVKGVLNKTSNRSLPPGSFPNRQGNQAPIGTITKPPSPTDDDDDDDDGAGSKGNYNVPLQTQLRDQQNTTSPYESAQPGNTSRNPPTNNMNPPRNNNPATPAAPQRNGPPERNNNPSTPAAPQRNAPPERNNNPSTPAAPQRNAPPERNNNPATTAAPPQRNAPPERNNNPSTPAAPQRNAPAERNANPTTPAAPPLPPPFQPAATNPSNTNTNPTTSAPMNNFFAAMNANPVSTNTQPNSVNFQPGSNSQMPSTNDFSAYMSTQQPSSLPQRDEDTISRLELDYPIENVLIDANIPSVIARKINDAVEQDRYGHKYHVHRYTYEPASQNLSHDNQNQYDQYSNNDRYSGGPKHRSGTRHIREIHHNSQNSQYDHLLATSPHEQYPRTSRNRNRHRSHSDIPLSQYVDQLLQMPGSTVVHAQNSDSIQNILAQHLPNNQILPATALYNPFQSNDIALPEPIVYYTAQALPNDPMRIY
ncbi:unnamed protein product [Adineta ricciae]|uniref:Uncharacterized protein n=1 Tax=Adineta ricciae TaxID=249248 RepID=A0A813PNE4_ADIRI|nr:unnamed protein product [Adineta ricciae]